VDVDLYADLLGFVHNRLEYFDLRLRWSRLGRQSNFTGVLDSLGGECLYGGTEWRTLRGYPES